MELHVRARFGYRDDMSPKVIASSPLVRSEPTPSDS